MASIVVLHDNSLVGAMVQRALVIAGSPLLVRSSADVAEVLRWLDEPPVGVLIGSAVGALDGLALLAQLEPQCALHHVPVYLVGPDGYPERVAAAIQAGAGAWYTFPRDLFPLRLLDRAEQSTGAE